MAATFALWAEPRFLTNSSATVHYMKNLTCETCRDTPDRCSGSMAGLLASVFWGGGGKFVFSTVFDHFCRRLVKKTIVTVGRID